VDALRKEEEDSEEEKEDREKIGISVWKED